MQKSAGQRSLQAVKLILGLGNPGPEYEETYHNAGALFAAYLVGSPLPAKRSGRLPFTARIAHGWAVARSTVFMNESGRAAAAALKRFGLTPEWLLVAHDESDLPLGEFRIAFGRGAAGHKGVASIITALGTKDFWRLRIGVRHEPGKAGKYVLRRMSAAHRETLYSVFETAKEKLTENVTP